VKEPVAEIQIRRATAADNFLLAELGAETFSDSFASENTPENMAAYLAESFGPEIQRRELAEPDSRFLIAQSGGSAAGYARLRFGSAPESIAGRKPVEIARIYAGKAWIGRGVGSRLMQACLEEAGQAGCDVIWLDVWERNPRAIAFYRSWNFTIVGTQTFRLGKDQQRDLLMARAVG
jgi:ribosomal protein S18 acetylase RimI-like enzyme